MSLRVCGLKMVITYGVNPVLLVEVVHHDPQILPLGSVRVEVQALRHQVHTTQLCDPGGRHHPMAQRPDPVSTINMSDYVALSGNTPILSLHVHCSVQRLHVIVNQ